MDWILIVLGFVLLLGSLLWYISDVKKNYKQEQDDFENPKHLGKTIKKDL